MPIQIKHVVTLMILLILTDVSSTDEARNTAVDYCQNESFRPRCLTNEVILVRSATYGRMRIGRCITGEEVAALVPHFGENPPNLGCSADILTFLDRNCFARRECEVRVVDISAENLKPCFPITNVYLEVRYDCISVEDEGRSCSVTASRNPTHIISSSQKTCGTESHPWHVEVSEGQRINVSLIESAISDSSYTKISNKKTCHRVSLILDKVGNRNTTICGGESGRENGLYLSTGNAVDIILLPTELRQSIDVHDSHPSFVLKFEAVGCSSIIPPEDAWLKRKDDVIVIGCYSNRQTWQLNCQRGKWIGVLGNCSHDSSEHLSVVEPEPSPALSTNGQVLAIVAICGFTLAICLAILCTGALCLRRMYDSMKKRDPHYKTLNYPVSTRSQPTGRPFPFDVAACSKFTGDNIHGFETQPSSLHLLNEGQAVYNINSLRDVEDNINQSA